MPNRQTRRSKSGDQPERSPKAHVDQPPLEIEPTGDTQDHQRGETGQFTDKGAPGLIKK